MKRLNLFAPINTTGFGYHSAYTMKYLLKEGWDVRHLPIGRSESDFPLPSGNFHHDAPCLKIWHPFDMSGFTGTKKIGFTNFELESLKPKEVHSLKYPDKMLVPTKWAQRVCTSHGISTEIVPLGYDDSIFMSSHSKPSDKTIFGNFGKWEIRKGHDVLIKAFNSAFTKSDNVSLVMMPSNPFLSQEQIRAWEKMYKESSLGDKVQIIGRVKSHVDVFNIMGQIDCGIFPARAEGWNLEALEVMGCDKEIIITNCTGHSEFINKSCHIVDVADTFEPAYDGIFFDGSLNWRKIDNNAFDQIVEHMRTVHNNRNNRKSPNTNEQAKKYTWKNSINILMEKI